MLQGRIAPPCSPAVGPREAVTIPTISTTTDNTNTPAAVRPMPRRNSFSRDTMATIAMHQQPGTSGLSHDDDDDRATLNGIHLHVRHDALKPPLSPRKAASFSLPKTPRQDTLDPSTPQRVLRPTLSDFQLRRPSVEDTADATTVPSTNGPSIAKFQDDVYLGDDLCDQVLTGDDSPITSDDEEDDEGDEEREEERKEEREEGEEMHSSRASSSYSPVSPTRVGDLADGDDDTFASWLLESQNQVEPSTTTTPTTTTTTTSVTIKSPTAYAPAVEETRNADLVPLSASASWLQLPVSSALSPSIELSKSVQQIEHEIRHAIDSAASRVSDTLQRRDQFHQSMQQSATSTSSTGAKTSHHSDYSDHTELPDTTNTEESREPELLLLMEVLIGDGRSETLEVFVGDEPQRLAHGFALKHGLAGDAIPRLAQHIQEQLKALEEEEEQEEEEQREEQETASHLHHQYQDGRNYHEGGEEMEKEDEEEDEELRLDTAYDSYGEDYEDGGYNAYLPPAPLQVQSLPQPDDQQAREHEREHSYRNLMEKYGHYSSHSNKVNPTHSSSSSAASSSSRPLHAKSGEETGRHHGGGGGGQDREGRGGGGGSEPLTMQNVEHARLLFTPRPVAFGGRTTQSKGTSKSKTAKDATVYDRLYALAEAREKWIRRQQKAKAADEMRDQQSQQKLEISSKSRDLIAGRGSGGYAHIGERLYDEALSEMAKKQRECEKRAMEKSTQMDWTCAKCAFVNQHSDAVCKNMVASLPAAAASPTSTTGGGGGGGFGATTNTMALLDAHPELVCGYARPQQLFRPTLITQASSTTASVLLTSRQRSHRSSSSSSSSTSTSTLTAQSQRRQRTQQQMEDEFRQTCPFKPKINDMSEEIMRDKLAQEVRANSGTPRTIGTTATSSSSSGHHGLRRKDPHKALYEDAFHARAHKEAMEQEYMAQFSFKPNIGVNALWGTAGFNTSSSSSTSTSDAANDVVERLAVSKLHELERKRASLHTKYAPDRDPTTGREYFKPETGRAPIFNRNERGLPIGEFLYQAHKEHAEYHRRLKQQEGEQLKQQREQRFLSSRSKQALDVRKNKTFARLFAYLLKLQQRRQQDQDQVAQDATKQEREDATGEPRVVPRAVELSDLPPEIARVVGIVFEFAQHEPFTFAQFELFMDKLMKDVPGLTCTQVMFLTENLHDGKSSRRVVDKSMTTSDRDEELEDAELTFRPVIDKNSALLAKKHGRAERTKVFEALNQYYDHYKDRQDQAKRQREREFVRAHPFQPTLVTKDRRTTASAASFYEKLHHNSELLTAASPTTTTTTSTTATRTTSASSVAIAIAAGAKTDQDPSLSAPALRTAVPNARPFVRPIPSSTTTATMALASDRSRAGSMVSSKHSDDDEEEDSALTSRVLAALDERPMNGTPSSSSLATAATVGLSELAM